VSKDITPILAGWDFDPEDAQVRIVPGDDGHDKLQMRLDLGVLQMELGGRPDGRCPHGSSRCWTPMRPASGRPSRMTSS
jgi:hypothetical protein